MKIFKIYVFSKKMFHKSNPLPPIFIAVFSLLLITTVFSQTKFNFRDNGNYALQFNGIEDEVLVGNLSSLDILGDITICAWFKTDTPQWGSLVSNFDQHNPDNGYEVCVGSLYEDGGFIYFECTYNDARDGLSTDNSFSDGKWHFVSAIYTPDGSSRGRVFVDGIEQTGYYWGGSVPVTAIGATPSYPLKFGASSNRTGPEARGNFKGTIDEVRIWDRALTLQEIHINMYNHLTGIEEGLVGYWPFNEGAGSIVTDFSGNNNNGTIQGAIWAASSAPIGTVIISCNPNYGYQNHNLFTSIQGANTHFLGGTNKIWLSKNGTTITADRYAVNSNTLLEVKFYIPPDASPGQWNINVETAQDSIITMPIGIEILPPPSVSSQNSSTSSWLQSVYAIDDVTCWSVGNNGSIQMTTDGGVTWETQNSGTSNVLYSTFFTDDMTGWAVGQYGTILSTTNGGEDWKPQNSSTSNNLQSVYFVDANVGWTVGRSGTILKTTDGGLTWDPQNSGTTAWLYSVCFTNGNNGWAVGKNGIILTTIDGGASWESQISGTTNYLSSVHFCDSDTGWIVGQNGTILKSLNGGTNWISIDGGTMEWLKSTHFRDAKTGWAVGTNGVFIMTNDGGESWSTRSSFTNKMLNSIYFVDDNTGWVVGETGTILGLMMSNLATVIEDEYLVSSSPHRFELYQNYPNPFNPNTTIKYDLTEPTHVSLKIYSILGELIKEIVKEKQSAGTKMVMWDGTDQFGQKVSSGIYLYRLETDTEVQVRKMILLR